MGPLSFGKPEVRKEEEANGQLSTCSALEKEEKKNKKYYFLQLERLSVEPVASDANIISPPPPKWRLSANAGILLNWCVDRPR